MKRKLLCALAAVGIAAVPSGAALLSAATASNSALCPVGVGFGKHPGVTVDPQDPFGSGVVVETGDPYVINGCTQDPVGTVQDVLSHISI